MAIIQKLKDFYYHKKDFVLFVIIFLILFVAFSLSRTMLATKSVIKQRSDTANYVSNGSLSLDYEPSEPMVSESFSLTKKRGYSPPIINNDEVGLVEGVDKKIKKVATLNLEVEKKNYDSAKNNIGQVLTKYNGFYTAQNEQKTTWNNADYRTYYITIKFPKDKFDQAVNELKILGELKQLSINANDLTTQYYDTKGYLDNTIAVKARIQKLLDQAEEIEEIITIEQKLADLQRQIDNYQHQLNNIDRQTDYSQISITLAEKRGYVESIYEMTKLKDLFRNTMQSFNNVFVMISNLIGYLILFLIVWGAYKGIKRIKRKNLE
jgi:hypothetical protein